MINQLPGGITSFNGTAAMGLQLSVPSTSPGVFEGDIDLGTFKASDIRFITVGSITPFVSRYNGSTYYFRIAFPYSQATKTAGVFGDNYLLYAAVNSSSILNSEGTGVSIDNLSLKWAHSIMKINVYGKHPDMANDEVLKSVAIVRSSGHPLIIRFNMAANTAISGYPSSSSTITLTSPENITIADKTKDDGIVLWGATNCYRITSSYPNGGSSVLGTITVTTDKAVYTKSISHTYNRIHGDVHQFGINLANGFTRAGIEYSADGGTTWSGDLPASGASFSTLAARSTSSSFTLSEDNLAAIKASIDTQPAVELDLSGIKYSAAEFPAVFKSDAKLASIKFPSNVTGIAAGAFQACTGLKSVDLSNITDIRDSAFYNAGLVNLTVPSNVTSLALPFSAAASTLSQSITIRLIGRRAGPPALSPTRVSHPGRI